MGKNFTPDTFNWKLASGAPPEPFVPVNIVYIGDERPDEPGEELTFGYHDEDAWLDMCNVDCGGCPEIIPDQDVLFYAYIRPVPGMKRESEE